MKKLYPYFLLILVIFGFQLQAQNTNNNCASASPFCTGQTMNFPATTGVPNSQTGPSYGCLGSQPNPAWFFFQINSAGPMSISMSANNDIDFCCWGPFANLSSACGNLTTANIRSCSYSASNTETCTIANAVPGMFYMMIITNFSNSQQNITFNQSNSNSPGAATTNCGFVCVVSATNSGIVCKGGAVTLSITANTSTAVTSFTWAGPNLNSNNPIIGLSNVQSSANYTLFGTANSTLNGTPYSSTCQAVTSVSVVPYPTFSISPGNTAICQGGSVTANVVYTAAPNPGPVSYNWTSSNGGIIWAPQTATTLIQPPMAPVNVTMSTHIYSLTVTPNALNCPTTQTISITVNNPLTPSLTMPGPLCDVFIPVQLAAAPGGGTWSANPAVTAGGFFSPTLAAIGINTVQYVVNVGNCQVSNTATLEVSKFHTAALTGSVSTRCEQDPVFYLKTIVQDTATGSWSGTNVTNNFFNPAGLATGNYILTYNSPSAPNPATCPSSTTYVMPVFNPPIPAIVPIAPRCNTWGTVALSANPTGGVWNGNPGITLSGIQTPSLNANGVNSVTYTAGQGTCVASSVGTFVVSRFNTAALSGSIQPLCANGNPFNLSSIVQNTSGVWSGINVSNSAFSPAGLLTSVYTLSYTTSSSPNPTLCPDFNTTNVSVLNPPTPSIQAVGPYCSVGGTVQLFVLPNNVGQWIPSSYLSNTGVFSPTAASVGNNAVQYVIGTATCFAQTVNQISIEAFVPAKIIQPLGDLCTSNPAVNLAPYTANGTGNWTGPGINGNNFNPAISGAGSFKLIHTTASFPSGLCPDVDTLSARVFSLDAPYITPSATICNNGLPFQIKVSPLGGIFKGMNSNALSNSGLFNPAVGVIGRNILSYSISSGPCIAYAQSTVVVEEFVSAAVIRQPEFAYCVNHEPFNLNGFVKNQGGTWSGPGLVAGNMFYPKNSNIDNNNILYYHTQSASNPLLCPDVSSLTIYVKDLPKASIKTSSLNGCAPLEVVFWSDDHTAGRGLWSIDDGSKRAGFTTAYTFTHSGTYYVTYNYEDADAAGCAVQVRLESPIKVFAQPKANFEVPDEITMNDPLVKFINTSSSLPDNTYMWTVQGGEQYFDVNPTVLFPERGTYRVSLQATDVKGCKSTISRYIEVKNDLLFFVPNSFTPNFDDLNDVFKPVFSPFGLDPNHYSFQIFDRWGQQVFSTRDHSIGWDGTFMNKGTLVLKQDTYTYQMTCKDLDGRVYTRQGVVSLMR